jgi:phthiocerol/phenolphthiocerol synthesis type-I polyketide synthase C
MRTRFVSGWSATAWTKDQANRVKGQLAAAPPAAETTSRLKLTHPMPMTDGIAIIGAACRLPQAPDLDGFARLLADGTDAVTEIPAGRWSKALFYHPDPAEAGKSYSFAAGCLDQIDQFDPAFFGISPREAVQMDPQQRLLLELAWEALEDAGIRPSAIAASRTSVHVGGSSSDYVTLRLGDPASADAYFMTGSTLCSLANRISHAFNLRGASLTVDTACSSSLVALHLACEGLRSGEAELALVGGVNMLLAPQSFVGFSRAGMLSPRGRCHAFDAAADGYVRAEGGGVLVLKPLGAALADGDDIHAVIRATAVNSDGRTTGFSLPSQDAQAALLEEVYGRAGIRADALVYLEAHGTGTPVGDPIEAAAIGAVLGARRSAPLPIGSVKTNIGHLEAASGMAGLLKLIVALRSRVVPRSLHQHTPNPAIAFAALNLTVVAAPLAVPAFGLPAMGINSFGFGGTNAHAVLQAAPPRAPRDAVVPPPMLLLSARSEPALRALAACWRDRLAGIEAAALGPLLRGAARARELHPHRLALIGADAPALADALDRYAGHLPSASVIAGTALRDADQIGFAFSGNGSQWAGMAQDALAHSPAFAAAIDRVDALLHTLLGWSVRAALAQPDAAALRRTEMAQPLLFATQVASVEALRAVGITAAAHLGHSAGEVAAAWACGALSLADAARVIAVRSRLQQRRHGIGGMAMLGLAEADAQAAIADLRGLCIAAVNTRAMVTIAGGQQALAALGAQAEAQGWSFLPLDLDYAFHSALMDPIRADLLRELADIAPHAARAPFASTVTGRIEDGAELDAAYWWRNIRAPVRFADAAAALVAGGIRLVVEIGPQAVLQAFLRDALTLADVPGRVLPALTRRPAAADPFLLLAARCHVAGHDISGGRLFDGPAEHRALPRYPWQRERYWFARTEEATDLLRAPSCHALLGFRRNGANAGWFSHLDIAGQGWLADHVVDRAVLLPAAAVIDMALAACLQMHPEASTHELWDLEIVRPLVLEPAGSLELSLTPIGADGRFELACRPRLSAEAPAPYATGRAMAEDGAIALGASPPPRAALRTWSQDAFYRLAARFGLEYGAAFRTVRAVVLTGDETAVVELGAGRPASDAVVDPTLLDGALQGLVALVADRAGDGRGSVRPFRFGRVRLLRRHAVPVRAHLRITQAGPRSVCADIALLEAGGATVLELLECWFVAVPGGTDAGAAEHVLIETLVPTLARETMPVLPGAAWPARMPGPAEPLLLADAFLASAAFAAVAALSVDGALVPGRLAADGRIAAAAAPWLEQMLSWLEQDGLASRHGAQTVLAATSLLPEPAPLFGSLLFDDPGQVAEAALLGQVGAGLGERLRTGAIPALPAALLDQLLTGSTSAESMLAALAAEFAVLVADWPSGRRLGVLELEAGSGALTRRLVPHLIGRAGCRYTAVTSDPDARAALQARLADLPGSRVLLSGSAELAALADIDIGIGLHALTRHAGAATLFADALRRDGVLLLAEPAPNRLWQALAASGLGCAGGLRASPQWRDVLEDAGFGAVATAPIDTSCWPASRFAARCLCAQPPTEPAVVPGVLLLCGLDKAADGALRDALPDAVLCEEGDLPHLLARASEARPTLVLAVGTPAVETIAATIAMLAGLAAPLAEAGAMLLLVVRAAASGDLAAAAVQGVRRVLVNETGTTRCRMLRIAPGFDDTEAAALVAAELARDDGEDEIAWTESGRYVTRLRRGLPISTPVARPVCLAVARPGLLNSLVWQPAPERSPGPGEVTIEITAAGLNFRDVMWALGLLPDEALLHGFAGATLGLECAGRVLAVGAGVTDIKPGTRIMGFAPAALSSRTVTAAQAVVPIPDFIGDLEAATLPVAFVTVAYALGTLGQLAAGERVLIHGGAGGVGLAAVQYASHRGAEIFATAGSPAKRAVLRWLGVAHVLDSRSLSFADDVLRLTDGAGVDVVLNSLGGGAMERSLGLLRPFGRFIELGKRDFYRNTTVGLRPLRHNVSYFAVDADQLAGQRPELAARLLEELGTLLREGALRPLPYRRFDFAEAEAAFRLMQGSLHVGKIVLTPGDAPPSAAPIPVFTANPNASYVLTGALSGFGRRTADWLVAHGARALAVLSRSGPADPAATDLAAACDDAGVRLLILACDVADEPALDRALAAIRDALPPIAGVIHCAMVLDDGLLPQLDAARITAVLRPKVAGALALDRLTRGDPIELFVLFSSIVTAFGNPGQASYVAANAAIEALAQRRHAEGLPALAVAWGPIAETGVLARDARVGALLARRIGAAALDADRALAALPALLAAGVPVVGYASINWNAASHQLAVLAGRLAEDLRTDTIEPQGGEDLRATLASLAPEQAAARLAALLIEQVADILRLSPERIDPDTPLAELGMDSLMAVELRLAVERRCGLSLPLLSLANGVTPATLAARLVRALGEPAAAARPSLIELAGRHEPAKVLDTVAGSG